MNTDFGLRNAVKMIEWMKSAGLSEPEYKEEMGGFSVYFYNEADGGECKLK